MTQIIVNIDDKLLSQILAYTSANQTSFDKMTEQLWLDFLKNQQQSINQLD